MYIAYEHRDEKVAEKITEVLQSYEFSVFRGMNETEGSVDENSVWEAMAESRAVVAVIPDDATLSAMAFELGAATAWNKPIYGVTSRTTLAQMPHAWRNMKLFPMSRIDEVAQLILRSSQPISEHEVEQLSECYVKIGIPADQLALQPNSLAELVRKFNKMTKRQMSGEEVLSLLLRLRKRQALPSLKMRSPKSHKPTAKSKPVAIQNQHDAK
ncbi:MAG: hypothetical protein WD065_18785 [Planctomycetaceae bacterium]